jgi:rod shape-determining protein MreD
MTPFALWTRVDVWLRSTTPTLITLVLALLPALPIRLPGDFTIVPALTLMSVYYWTIYRPDLLPLPTIFGVGVLEDVVTGAPLGLTALTLLGCWALVVGQRRIFFGRPFGIVWGGFLLVAGLAATAGWMLSSLLVLRPLPLGQSAAHLAATVLVFPVLVWFFINTHRRVLPRI